MMDRGHSIITLVAACVVLMCSAAHASSDCLTKSEAREQYPNSYLKWRGERHCWYSGRSQGSSHKSSVTATHALAEVKTIPPMPLTTSKPKTGSEIYYPTLIASQAAIAADVMAMQRPITEWPLLLDIDAVGPDPDHGIDACCWPPLESLK